MAENVEIKARVRHFDRLQSIARSLSNTAGELLNQEDIFFNVPQGRLKLRILDPTHGQLIYYERPDQSGPKTSYYDISRTSEPSSLVGVLSQALGIRGKVVKQRWLYLVGQTRIHLDRVENLGDFMELEVVMQPGQPAAEGEKIARRLMDQLGVTDEDLVDVAYIDLLEK